MVPLTIDRQRLVSRLLIAIGAVIVASSSAQGEWLIADGGMSADPAVLAKIQSDARAEIDKFTIELKKNPKNLAALQGRGQKYTTTWQLRKAVSDFSRALKLDPNDRSTYRMRADAYHLWKKYKKSIADYTKEIELAPDKYKGYVNRAYVESDAGLTQAAIEDCSKSISLKPNFHAYNLRSRMYGRLGQKEKQEQDLADSWAQPDSHEPYPED
jgi:tetratricopeptide (TPR) repeat protein